jgi:hypothetical protein
MWLTEQYSLGEANTLFHQAGLRVINSWKAPDSEYRLWLLERPTIQIQPSPVALKNTLGTSAATYTDLPPPNESQTDQCLAIPKWSDWQALWAIWDQ